MSTKFVDLYLPGITPEHFGAANSTTASIKSERTSALTSIAPQQHDAEESLMSAWLMIGSIIGCLVIMLAVLVGAAMSVP
jgi:hypothetical protein